MSSPFRPLASPHVLLLSGSLLALSACALEPVESEQRAELLADGGAAGDASIVTDAGFFDGFTVTDAGFFDGFTVTDAGFFDGFVPDTSHDFGTGADGQIITDASVDFGFDASVDGGFDAGSDGGTDSGTDGGVLCVPVDTDRELVIRNLAIVENPLRTNWTGSRASASDGAWHFGRLMTNMAGTQDPTAFVMSLFNKWKTDRVINGQTVFARPNIQTILDAWPKLSNGKIDLRHPPLRLLAIVNRMDLRNPVKDSAGEGRFVFGVLDAAGNPLPFTIILEYILPAANDTEVVAWANAWHELGSFGINTSGYKTRLQAITNAFAGANAAPGRPNGSAISQIRTNEIALAGPWELRQFGLPAAGGLLRETALTRTPIGTLNGQPILADFINTRETSILNDSYSVPATFQGAPFRAAAVDNNVDFWSASMIANNDARHLFSLNTCNGCHGLETNTNFLHVFPREAGNVAALSGFMTGSGVGDPVSGVPRLFNDLQRRAEDFASLLCPASQEDALAGIPVERVH